jgi:glutamate--cysteine ligase
MGRLGYQSDAQSALAVSYNSLKGYAASLQDALTHPYPAYEAIGLRDEEGRYKQLSTSLLQIENEFYSTIRPKRVIRSGERPLHALRERGVEYVEVRCMDLNPFLPVGIDEATARFLDIFLLHCVVSDSPADTPEEIAALVRNQQCTAERGREPGLMLERHGEKVLLVDWARALMDACQPVARRLDAVLGGEGYREAWQAADAALKQMSLLPSARVVAEMSAPLQGGDAPSPRGHAGFARWRSGLAREALLAVPVDETERARLVGEAAASVTEQRAIEQSDTRSFEAFLEDYMAPSHLVV